MVRTSNHSLNQLPSLLVISQILSSMKSQITNVDLHLSPENSLLLPVTALKA